MGGQGRARVEGGTEVDPFEDDASVVVRERTTGGHGPGWGWINGPVPGARGVATEEVPGQAALSGGTAG